MGNPHPVTAWKSGEQPKSPGRPKTEWDWKTLLKEEGDIVLDGVTKKKRVVEKTYQKAIAGDIIAAKAIMDRTDGLPTQKTELSGEVKTSAALPMTPEIAKLAEEYEQRILEQLKKSNSQP